jgi:dihydropteroate synthase
MGILNATPDSFAGDGLAGQVDALVARGLAQVAAGAEILDLGGESSRPHSAVPISLDEELGRVLPVLKRLLPRVQVPISIDTVKPAVAEATLALGAVVVNDVSSLADPTLAAVAARHDAWYVLMHNWWTPHLARRRQERLAAQGATGDVVDEVVADLEHLTRAVLDAGVRPERLVVDPGLGFGKTAAESLELLHRTAELHQRLAPYPLLIGPSRKRFVGRTLGLPVEERVEGTLACVAAAVLAGAEIVRVHDVALSVRVARMAWAIHQGAAAHLAPPATPADADS